MTTPTWDTLSIDTRHALRTAASRLADEFAGIYGRETIERFLYSSYDQLAPNARVTRFVPLFAEKFARQRLRALAKVEGLHYDGKPTVLFLCTHNAGRSQMALGFFQALTTDRAIGWSGGSEPGPQVNPSAIAAMAERGIDISAEFPKLWTDETVRAADVVVSMGCGDACPHLPRQTLRILGRPGRSRRPGPHRRPPHPRRHRTPRPTADRRTRPHSNR
jgi:arsenate reductase